MAADDAGERTEQPTARRLSEARSEGRVPRSMDLTAAVALLGGILLLKVLGGGMFENMIHLVRSLGDPPPVRIADLRPWVLHVAVTAAKIILPFLALLVIITVSGSVLQSGFLLTWKKLKPDLTNLSLLKGIKRIFSLQSVTRVLMGLLKMAVVAAVAYYAIAEDIEQMLAAGGMAAVTAFQMCCSIVYKLALRMGFVLLILALLDYAYQRWQLMRDLKMTKQEVKDEMKRMEGDPQMKARRRQVQFQVALQRVKADVPKADVVVTNPTHYAVALRYNEETMAAPRVIAKGADFIALRIRQVAKDAKIPIVERPPLARALYAEVEVGQEVPPNFYKAIAEVLAYVYELNGRRPSAA